MRDEDREFVAAEPRGGVGSAHALADALGRLDQQPVAGQVAEAVVDELELVDVEEEHGDLAVGALGSRERVIEAIDEERAVRQSREGIGQGLPYRVCRRAVESATPAYSAKNPSVSASASLNWRSLRVATTRLPTIEP